MLSHSLAETIKQLEAASDTIPALISYVGSDFRYRMCNRAYSEWFILPRSEVVGKTVREVLGDPMWQVIGPHMEAAMAGEKQEFEIDANYLHGGRRWIHVRYTPHLADDGTVEGVVVMVTDVTSRHEAEDRLRKSEERYRALFDSIDEGFCVIEMLFDERQKPVDYRFLEVNPAFEKQAGMHGATGKRMLEFVTHIERHWLENYGRVAITGEPIRFADEYKSLHSWFDVYAFRVGDPGANKVAVLFNNITKRKAAESAIRESEERFRNMSNHCPVMLWVTDENADCIHLNERWLEFTGQTAEEGLGHGWLEAVHPDDRDAAGRTFLAANAEQRSFEIEYRLRRRDGIYRWALDTATPRISDSGAYLGFIGSVLDIHERRELEDTLRQAKEHAESASRAKDTFLAQLSHELRTPLTPVLMTASALREDETLPDHVREQLEMIERNVGLEARLIDDLLDLTRITRGKLVLRAEECNVHSLLWHVLEIVQEEAREKKIELTISLDASRALLNGDPTRLQQLFWNIVRNAVKFTGVGGRIRVASSNVPAPDGTGQRVRVQVSDDGIGFSPTIGKQIFEPFERGVSDDQKFPGLGLGLAIARAIVDLHGGSIQAESLGENRGSTFTVDLPASSTAVTQATHVPEIPASAPEAETPLRLMVVEDHPPTLQVIARMLQRAGHSVKTASSLAQARELVAHETFDAVLSDVGLPDGTGVELMTELRANHGLRGIALSGYGMEEDVQRSLEAGFVAHLVKPVEVHELRRALARLHP